MPFSIVEEKDITEPEELGNFISIGCRVEGERIRHHVDGLVKFAHLNPKQRAIAESFIVIPLHTPLNAR